MEKYEFESWGIEEVGNWLEKTVALPQYKPTFAELAIDGSLLQHILDEDLMNDFQIKIRLHRIKIIEAIKKLKVENTRKIEEDFVRKCNIGSQDEHSEEEKESKPPSFLTIVNDDSDEEIKFIQGNDGRVTPEREEEDLQITNMNARTNPHQSDGRNPAVEVIGIRQNQTENYIDETDDSSQVQEDQDEKLIIVLKVVEGQQLNNVYLIGEQGARLGRHSASNDIVISESFVSRKH